MAAPRVFVSYNHRDAVFTQRLVDDLKLAGVDVRLDVGEVGADDFKARIHQTLASCEWFLLVLTPRSITSPWVLLEMDTVIRLWVHARVRDIILVLAEPVAPADIPTTWGNFTHVDATRDYASARDRILGVVDLPPFPDTSSSSPPPRPTPSLQPARDTESVRVPPAAPTPPILVPTSSQLLQPLLGLDFAVHGGRGTEVLLPPLCVVPAGEFLMGSDTRQDTRAYASELPRHRVEVPAFHIARYPVTVAEYACFVRAGHRAPKDWRAQVRALDHPVVSVSWRDATAYAAWLAAEMGQPWRLPSEAEWEKAARWDGHTSRIYPWGDTFDHLCAHTRETGSGGATSVDNYLRGASPCGALGMSGNVWEWTSSRFMPYPYSSIDGRETPAFTGNWVRRGGSWTSSARSARAAYRYFSGPDDVSTAFGFRLALASAAP